MRTVRILRNLAIALIMVVGLLAVLPAQGPLTPLSNIQLRTDSLGNLMVVDGTYSGVQGPASTNPRVRVDSNGSLLVALLATINADASCFGWTTADTSLCRDAANAMAVENRTTGATAQAFRVYNTTDSVPTNYERAVINWTGNVAQIGTEQGGTGTARALSLGTAGSANTIIRTNGVDRFFFYSGGILGASSTGTPIAYVAGSVTATTFCTSPSVTGTNTLAFSINVGTSCATSTATMTFPATATNGWKVDCVNVTANATNVVSQTGGSTTTATLTNYVRTTGVAGNWTDSNVLRCNAMGY